MESAIPNINPSRPRLSAKPALEFTIADGEGAVLFDIINDRRYARISVENTSAKACKIKASTSNDDEAASADDYDTVLAGGSAAGDGLGSSITYDVKDRIQAVSAWNSSGADTTLRVKVWNSDRQF